MGWRSPGPAAPSESDPCLSRSPPRKLPTCAPSEPGTRYSSSRWGSSAPILSSGSPSATTKKQHFACWTRESASLQPMAVPVVCSCVERPSAAAWRHTTRPPHGKCPSRPPRSGRWPPRDPGRPSQALLLCWQRRPPRGLEGPSKSCGTALECQQWQTRRLPPFLVTVPWGCSGSPQIRCSTLERQVGTQNCSPEPVCLRASR
mmetsp:Transcript_24774/g.63153  ORF Transcript_24774/g.63153 Transcript_24774/m.63153 type:complete len:203 (-) Transcript_24774:671-1279(-)